MENHESRRWIYPVIIWTWSHFLNVLLLLAQLLIHVLSTRADGEWSDSVINIHVSILFQILFSFMLLRSIKQTSLCYTVVSCWLHILFYLSIVALYSCVSFCCKAKQINHVCPPPFFFPSHLGHHRALRCYTVGSHYLFVLYIVLYIHQSQYPNSSDSYFSRLISICLFSMSVSLFLVCR